MKDLSVPMNRLQLSMLPFIFASGLLVVIYGLLWGWSAVFDGFDTFLDFKNFVPTFILGVIAHEGLHGSGWKYAANLKWSDFTYGVQWSTLTPYAHSKKPMRKSAYLIGSLLPAIVLGIIPYLLALIIGHNWLMMFGFVFTLAAGGDFWVVYTLRHTPADAWVQDHPENAGCIVYEDEAEIQSRLA
jgi:hypothetical protein